MQDSERFSGGAGHEIRLQNSAGEIPTIRLQLVDPSRSDSVADTESGGLWEFGRVLWGRKGTVVLIALACALAGFLIALPQRPIYQARTLLEIQSLNENFLNLREFDPNATVSGYSAESYLDTQVKILQDEALVERVVEKLQLEKRPEFIYRPGRLSVWSKALGLAQPPPPTPQEQATAMAAGNLKVRSSGQTRIVEILFDSPDPRLATDFVNTLASEFIEQNLELRWQASQKTGEWLTRQLGDLKRKLESSEDQLLAYSRAAGLMFTSEKDSLAEQKLRLLQNELSQVQADLVAKQSKYETASSSLPESLPEVLDSGPLREYQVKLTDLRRQLAELSAAFTPAFYRVKNVQAQVNELESILQKERINIVNRIRNEYQSAQRREKLVETAYAEQAKLVSEQAEKLIHYNILKREVETTRSLYETMLQKVKEAGIASALRASNIRVIHPAKQPSRPYKPTPLLNSTMGLLAGIFLGAVFVLLRENADRTLKAPGDASLHLKVPELGAIPAAAFSLSVSKPRDMVLDLPSLSQSNPEPGRLPSGVVQGEARGHSNGGYQVELATWSQRPSILAESFRATLASMLFANQNGKRPRVIVLTSPDASEGKTTMVTNLGIALAETNRRVLLIDGDMRKPRLHDIFELSNRWGLSDLLLEDYPIEEYPFESVVRVTKIPGLYVLPSGRCDVNISNLLYSTRMTELLWRFRLEFHTVLIDTPPMLQLSDARVLGRVGDGVILVFRAAHTSRDTALAASHRFQEDGTPVLGTILNYWDPNSGRHGYSGRYYRNAGYSAQQR